MIPDSKVADMLDGLARALPPTQAAIVQFAAVAVRGGAILTFALGGDLEFEMGPVSIRCSGISIRTDGSAAAAEPKRKPGAK